MRIQIVAALCLVPACAVESKNQLAANESTPSNTAEAGLQPPAPGQPGALTDDRTPIAEGPIDPRSAQGAGQVVQHYFALIETRRFAQAAQFWRDRADAASFAAQFARYHEVHANIGAPGTIEGAAGSAYVDVPIQIYGRLANGVQSSRLGTASLRRVNDVPGSTAEQRLWRIDRIALAGGAASTARYRFVGRWAAKVRMCGSTAWRFTATSLETPAGSVCRFSRVTDVPGGYDIAARCTAEGPPTDDVLQIRFAESARALLFESRVIADAGLVRCPD